MTTLPIGRRAALFVAGLALAASPFALAACGSASAENISDTIKSAYNQASSVTQMDSITCDGNLDATVGATTTCTAMTSAGDGTAEQKVLVTAAAVSDGQIQPTIATTSVDADAAFMAALLSASIEASGGTVTEVTCAEGAKVAEGDAPAEVSCDVTGTDADGAELATSYTASLTNEAKFSAEPAA